MSGNVIKGHGSIPVSKDILLAGVLHQTSEYLAGASLRSLLTGALMVLSSLMASKAMAGDDLFDQIVPTGYWYTSAVIDYRRLDGCFSSISANAIDYESIFPSLEAAKKALFHQKYKGGQCKEFIASESDKPQDWPLSTNQWESFRKQRPSAPMPMSIRYDCVISQLAQGKYTINFRLNPQYRCTDGTCTPYRKACAGDVYAGDLLQSPLELLGHTGILYTADELNQKESHLVMEVLNIPPIIHTNVPLNDIKKERPVWGVRYGYGTLNQYGEMSYLDALQMLALGLIQKQHCPVYTKQPIYKVGGYSLIAIINPINHQKKKLLAHTCAVFRCDTFIQYLYKTVLNVQLPPNTLLQMPKDLFNAFINQRGEIIPSARVIINRRIVPKRPNSLSAWDSYQNKTHSLFTRSASLDAIENSKLISFNNLIQAARTEHDEELKSQLLYLLFKKSKEEKITKSAWDNLKTISQHELHVSLDTRVITTSLLLSGLVLTDDDFLMAIQQLVARRPQFSDKNDLIMIDRALNMALFDLLIRTEVLAVHQAIDTMVANLNSDEVIESFSVYINELPEKHRARSRAKLYRYLQQATATFFKTGNFPTSHFRATAWSSAYLKTKPPSQTAEQVLAAFITNVDEVDVASLLIVVNQPYWVTPSVKQSLLASLTKPRLRPLQAPAVMDSHSLAQARFLLTH